ncbi:MAG: hypothetical protein U1G05_20350, partial [Kiritimatiellia bacterium]
KAVFAALPALLLMSDAYLKARDTFIDPVSTTAQSPSEKWDWATQWSWPPAETVDFIAPGYHGLRSGDADAEYWGVMGRSPGWEKTGEGFRNFKLESQYLGALPAGLALLAAVLAFAPFARNAGPRGDLRFWTVATVLLFLLSCGKYLPLYRLFYELPLMASIRNPNKFLQVFQLAFGVLAAFGLDALLGRTRATLGTALRRHGGRIAAAAGVLAGVTLLAWLVGTASTDELTLKLASQHYAGAAKLAALAASSLGHAFAMTAALAALLWLGLAARWADSTRLHAWLIRAALALVVLDAVLLSRDFITSQDLRTIRGNPVAAFLKREAAGSRVHALDQSGLYGHLLTYVFPYEGVDVMNVLAAPRLRSDVGEYMNATGRNILRQWNHFGVSHVLASAGQWEEIRRSPALAGLLEPVMGWGAVADARSGFRFVEVPLDRKPPHLILRYKGAPGRYRLVGAWHEVPRAGVLKALADPAGETDADVWVEAQPGEVLPAAGAPGPAGTVKAVRGINQVDLAVEAARPALLVLSDHFNPRIHAWVDGKPVSIRRANHLLIAVPVPAGASRVVVRFEPSRSGIRAVQAGLAVCFAAGVSLLQLPGGRRRRQAA